MSRMLVLVEMLVDVLEFVEVEDWLKLIRSQNLPGLESTTLWRSADEPSRHLLVTVYSSKEDSETTYRWLSEHPLIGRLQSRESVPDFTNWSVISGSPESLQAPWMSMVQAWASAGFEAEQETDLRDLLGELSYASGELGSLLGRNGARFASLVFWSTAEAFRHALPAKPLHQVRLFEQVNTP